MRIIPPRPTLRRFVREESGVATLFALFLILMIVLVGGIGVDLMHAEMERVRLQQTLDRAVLAAADLDQPRGPQEVVEDYFAKAGMTEYLTNVDPDRGLNYRTVSATAQSDTKTQYMRLMGRDTLSAMASSRAEERISNVEVSLVLDISGSMRNNNKMSNLQTAAKQFVQALIRSGTDDLISVNLVPYSEHVNVGTGIFNQLNTVQRHNYSHCVEIPDAEFASAALNTAMTYQQMQHFQWNSASLRTVVNTVCPSQSARVEHPVGSGLYERVHYESILPLSQNTSEMERAIDLMQPRAGTSIFMGVKWGAALLDPSTRSIVNNLISNGTVDAAFSGRPANYDDEDTLKTLIVMSDGKNAWSNRIRSWAYDSNSDYVNWATYNFSAYLSNYVYYRDRPSYYYRKYDATDGDRLTRNICNAAKARGIVIWGVGFELDDHGASVLSDCASSPSHFFRVEGVEISTAFRAIASQINQLRLTQ